MIILDFTSNCLVLRYDEKPGSVEFKIPKDLMRQGENSLSLIPNPQIYKVDVWYFEHRRIPFQITNEDDQYVTLRVDVPINEPVIYVNFVDKCSVMCHRPSLPKSTGYSVGIFFVTLIIYYVFIWIFKNKITIRT